MLYNVLMHCVCSRGTLFFFRCPKFHNISNPKTVKQSFNIFSVVCVLMDFRDCLFFANSVRSRYLSALQKSVNSRVRAGTITVLFYVASFLLCLLGHIRAACLLVLSRIKEAVWQWNSKTKSKCFPLKLGKIDKRFEK